MVFFLTSNFFKKIYLKQFLFKVAIKNKNKWISPDWTPQGIYETNTMGGFICMESVFYVFAAVG